MRPIPPKMKKEILSMPEYKTCMRNEMFDDHICHGRITLEHAFIYQGKQINEVWAIVSICAWAHDVDEYQGGGNLDKEKNQYCGLIRASEEDLAKYPRRDWGQLLKYFIGQYGQLEEPKSFTLF